MENNGAGRVQKIVVGGKVRNVMVKSLNLARVSAPVSAYYSVYGNWSKATG